MTLSRSPVGLNPFSTVTQFRWTWPQRKCHWQHRRLMMSQVMNYTTVHLGWLCLTLGLSLALTGALIATVYLRLKSQSVLGSKIWKCPVQIFTATTKFPLPKYYLAYFCDYWCSKLTHRWWYPLLTFNISVSLSEGLTSKWQQATRVSVNLIAASKKYYRSSFTLKARQSKHVRLI